MPFTDPATITTNQRLSRDELNIALRDNMEALKNPPTAAYLTNGQAVDYSTTSTSFVDIDATNLALTITTTGNGSGGNADVMIGLCGTLFSSSDIFIYLRILRDGATINIDADGLLVSQGNGNRPIGFMFLDANVSAGTHTYKLQWHVNSGTGVLLANAGTSTRDAKTIFFVREMS